VNERSPASAPGPLSCTWNCASGPELDMVSGRTVTSNSFPEMRQRFQWSDHNPWTESEPPSGRKMSEMTLSHRSAISDRSSVRQPVRYGSVIVSKSSWTANRGAGHSSV